MNAVSRWCLCFLDLPLQEDVPSRWKGGPERNVHQARNADTVHGELPRRTQTNTGYLEEREATEILNKYCELV